MSETDEPSERNAGKYLVLTKTEQIGLGLLVDSKEELQHSSGGSFDFGLVAQRQSTAPVRAKVRSVRLAAGSATFHVFNFEHSLAPQAARHGASGVARRGVLPATE